MLCWLLLATLWVSLALSLSLSLAGEVSSLLQDVVEGIGAAPARHLHWCGEPGSEAR